MGTEKDGRRRASAADQDRVGCSELDHVHRIKEGLPVLRVAYDRK